MREPTRREDARNLSLVWGAGITAGLLTLALLLRADPAPVYEVVVEPADPPQPAPVVDAVPEPPPPPQVEPEPEPVVVPATGDNRIFGKVYTLRGMEYEGYIRWDRNEGSWADLLDANKRGTGEKIHVITKIGHNDRSHDRSRSRSRGTVISGRSRGVAIASAPRVRVAVPEVEVRAPEVRVRVPSVDVHVRDKDRHAKDVDVRIKAMDVRVRELTERAAVLSQTMVIGNGSSQAGIRFGHLRRIEALDSRSALFVLKSGLEVELTARATDLGSGMRALIIEGVDGSVAELGWRDVDMIEFYPAPEGASPPNERIYGTMTTRSGHEFTGYVTWDVDEIYSTDILDGEDRGVDREIPFGSIEMIERYSSGAARVVLDDGTETILRGTNDVNESNNGISVSDPGVGQVKISWREFESVRFHEAESHAGYESFDGATRLYGTVVTDRGDEFRGELVWDRDEAYTWEMLNGDLDGIEFHVELGNVAKITPISDWGSEVELKDGRTFRLSDSNDVDGGNRGVTIIKDDGETVHVSWKGVEEVRFESR